MLKRLYKPVKTFSVKRDGFFGELCVPEKNIFPEKAIIIFGGSAGKFLLTQLCGDKFAEAGLSVIMIEYHGQKGLPSVLKDQPVDVIENAAKWLLANGYKKVGLWGISMGGGLALLAGSLMPELISCVVAAAPLQMVMQAEDNKTPIEGSSFAFHGKPLPYAEFIPDGKEWNKLLKKETLKHREPYSRKLLLDAYKADKNKSAEIAVEKINGPILLVGGAMDSMCPNEYTFKAFEKRLKSADFPHEFQSIIYPHLSHFITPIKPLTVKMFYSERKYPAECDRERAQCFDDTISFLKIGTGRTVCDYIFRCKNAYGFFQSIRNFFKTA